MCVCVCPVANLCLTLCNPVDCSPPGSSVHGTFQTRILEWVVISSSRGSSRPRDQTCISCIGRWIFTTWATWEAWGNIQRVQIWQSWVWSRASDDLVEITGTFFYVNIGCCKQIGEGVPGEGESSMTSFWSKTFCDLSLATMLALKQVSVINDLEGRKDCRNEGKADKKQWV